MTAHSSNTTRHHYFRVAEGESLPDGLTALLREAAVATGWLRGHGVIEDVAIRVYSPSAGGLGPMRRLQGALHVVSMDGTVGLAEGSPAVSLRVVLSRETDGGNAETWSGELAYARVVGLEVHAVSSEDLALALAMDPRAGVMMLGDASAVRAPRAAAPAPRAAAPARSPEPPAAWGDAIAASAAQPEPRHAARRAPGPPAAGALIPPRPPVRHEEEEDGPFPEAGDVVEHFAFGRCDVLRSDGDRLHLKVDKDGRIREIALEMLKVTRLGETDSGHHRYKLDRKL